MTPFQRSPQDIELAFLADNQARVGAGVLYHLAKSHRPHGWLHGGDAVHMPQRVLEWYSGFLGPLGGEGLVFAARGNHDGVDGMGPAKTNGGLCGGGHFHSQEGTGKEGGEGAGEAGGIAGGRGGYGAYTLGGDRLRLVVLDAEDHSTMQLAWLRRELGSQAYTSAAFRVVVVHIPPAGRYHTRRLLHAHQPSSNSATHTALCVRSQGLNTGILRHGTRARSPTGIP